MRRFAPLAFVFALFATTTAAISFLADFSGTWNVTVQGPQGAMASKLTLAQKADSVSGMFESEVGSAPLAGTVKGDSVRFNFAIDAGGQMLNLVALAALTDKDNLAGKIVAEGMGEFPFAGTRAK